MSQNLLKQRRFLPYFCTQFLGAFNDNIYKNALMILITYSLAVGKQAILLNIAAVLFILPFFLFGAIAGQLADKYEKSWLIRKIKLAEIGIMLFGCFALYQQSIALMLVTLFCLGAQSTFFGPIKYSILPQHLGRHEILEANGYVEAGTFIAILLGTILGGYLASDAAYQTVLMIILVLVAVVGWLVSRAIPSARPAAPDLKVSLNAWRSSIEIVKLALANKPVFQSILAISWFWFIGSIILTQFPTFASEVLSGDAGVATLLLATFSIGIGLGSLACSKLSNGRVEIGLMPIGAIGISVFTWYLGGVSLPVSDQLRTIWELIVMPGAWSIVFYMTMIAFSSGIFIVPLFSFIQVRSDEALRSRIFAVNNIVNSAFMILAGLLAVILLSTGFSVLEIFKIVAVMNILMAIYIISVVPEFFFRLIGWILIHSVYRIKKEDLHNIPEEGAALLVCNHVSYADPVIINAVCPRPARFVMINSVYQLPVAKKVFDWVRAIPIAPMRENPQLLERAYEQIAEALENGELVCIFPEGSISRDGELGEFLPGIERIIERTPVPIVPLAIRGLWGTWFSRQQGGAMRGLPKAFMKRLSIVSGEPVDPGNMTSVLMRDKVLALRGDEK